MSLVKDLFSQYLPPSPAGGGALPLWMAFISSVALFNTVQNFVSVKLTKQVYSGKPQQVTPLGARTFAVWTLLAAVVRGYAAYNIGDKNLYDIAIISYVLALGHFLSEFTLFRTANFGKGLLGPLVVATGSLYWMTTQRNYYLGL